MQYLFFDAAVNGYYALTLLKEAFQTWLPLMPAEEKIAEDVAPFIFEADHGQLSSFFQLNTVAYREIVLFTSAAALQEVQTHFSQFVIQEIKGRPFYFRFWSASVFKKFIESCNAEQLKSFFGPVQRFVCPDEHASLSIAYSLDGDRLSVTRAESNTNTTNAVNTGQAAQRLPGDNNPVTEITVELNSRKPARKFFS